MKIIIILLVLCSFQAHSRTFEFGDGQEFNISGYVGWKQIISDVKYDQVKSEPELGLITSVKLTDRLSVFNQFKWGENFDDILAYSNISYDLPIPVDYLTVTIKGGKLLHDTFLYNATRINPRTRFGVFQPQSVTWDSLGMATVSGIGIGTDIKYKNFTLSYIVDDMTIINRNTEAQAWTNNPAARNLQSGFGTQVLVLSYEMPEYGLFYRFWAQKENFTLNMYNQGYKTGGEHFGGGIEWTYDKFIASAEVMATKRKEVGWGNWKDVSFAPSVTVEYELNEHWVVRGNYNQYRTPHDIDAPEIARYYKDINFGVGWRYNNLMINAQVNYIQGGRLVAPNNVFDKPSDYDNYFVTGMNIVYFFD